MNDSSLPPDLMSAIGTQSVWLQAWVMVLLAIPILAVLVMFYRDDGRWRFHSEPIVIIISFVAAGILMEFLYQQFGYVRLLGLAHLVFWTPAYAWVLMRRNFVSLTSVFGIYLHFYLIVAGISLTIDLVDFIRYFVGN